MQLGADGTIRSGAWARHPAYLRILMIDVGPMGIDGVLVEASLLAEHSGGAESKMPLLYFHRTKQPADPA